MKVLYVIAGIVLAGYVVLQILFPTYTHRYRLTIEVEVDGKIRAASSVIEVRIMDQRNLPIAHGAYTPTVYGEAVFLDLGEGRHVIAILGFGLTGREHPPDVSTLARDAINPLPTDRGLDSLKLMSKLPAGEKAKLIGRQIPTMVTFADLTDPATAQVVPVQEFPRVFGPDVHFRAAWVEITNDSITRKIAGKLPLLVQLKAEQSKFKVIRQTDGFIPGAGYFSVER